MGITVVQKAAAAAVQQTAAHSTAAQTRLLAGPGTGKSTSIEERVSWLVTAGAAPDRVAVVSFTRASARDLETRIHLYGLANGQPELTQVHVSTLHALALAILRHAGLLAQYPVDPLVLDDWELREIIDAEFGEEANIGSIQRRAAVRRQYEAYCSTGRWTPPGLPQSQPPVTAAERAQFGAFLPPRSQLYSCVLPGELVKKCVDQAGAGLLDLVTLADIDHLIVDEYQDLNPVDLEFVDILAAGGVHIFVAGDDDQSIYAFRHAAPAGIQQFHTKYTGAANHTLNACFRCTPTVLQAAYAVVTAFPDPNRLPKSVTSLYSASCPPVVGAVHRWRFAGSRQEAKAIATSCAQLISVGVPAEDLLILLSSVPTLARPICDALADAGVPYEEPRPIPLQDTPAGRYVLALLRVVLNADDYIALRTLMGMRRGVGVATCNRVAKTILAGNVSLGDVATATALPALFNGRALTAVNALRSTVALVNGWTAQDQLGLRRAALEMAIDSALGSQVASAWTAETAALPDAMWLSELRAYLTQSSDGDRERLLAQVNARLGVAPPPTGVPSRVRVMTMHGSKGLSARVVFIPGLEEGLIPSGKNAPFPGLVAESGRLLFVSISRARAACVLSFATRRGMQGGVQTQKPSRFAASVGAWIQRAAGLTPAEAQAIHGMIQDL